MLQRRYVAYHLTVCPKIVRTGFHKANIQGKSTQRGVVAISQGPSRLCVTTAHDHLYPHMRSSHRLVQPTTAFELGAALAILFYRRRVKHNRRGTDIVLTGAYMTEY